MWWLQLSLVLALLKLCTSFTSFQNRTAKVSGRFSHEKPNKLGIFLEGRMRCPLLTLVQSKHGGELIYLCSVEFGSAEDRISTSKEDFIYSPPPLSLSLSLSLARSLAPICMIPARMQTM